jgi:hypothetical protein
VVSNPTVQACPTDAEHPRAAEIRPKRSARVPLSTAAPAAAGAGAAACVPAFGAARSVGKLATGNPTVGLRTS